MHFFVVCFSEVYSLQGWNYSPALHYLEGDDDAFYVFRKEKPTDYQEKI